MELDENRKLSFGLAIEKKTITRIRLCHFIFYRMEITQDRFVQMV
jgi:hypothetical protein